MKIIRIFCRSIRDSLKSFVRNFSLSIASILCVTITLLLVAFSLISTANINATTQNIEDELNIIVYLDSGVDEERIEELEEEFTEIEGVSQVTFTSKETLKLDLQESDELYNYMLNYLEENPLFDTFTVNVKDSSEFEKIANYISETNDVQIVKYGEGMVDSILSGFSMVQTITIAIVVGLVLVTVFLIGNTIKLTVFSRKNEIEIMRLVGASNTAIKLPFIFEGLLVGIVGAIIPVCTSVYGYIIFFEQMDGVLFTNMIPLVEPFNFIIYEGIALFMIGGAVGVIGSARAVRKYLKI